MSNAKPVPDGYEAPIAYLAVKGAAAAIDFYKKAFGATELLRIGGENGSPIGHAELRIGGGIVMLADEHSEIDFLGPQSRGGTTVSLLVYVEDVDALTAKAVASGAKIIRPLEDQFYGDRMVQLEDPFGHRWSFATHIEDVSPEEMERRAKEKHGS